ncbi:ABC transporter permease subunit [Phytohabitans sp. LJ34]|uniref:ABC transporter permease subunit n=1 Tax=Phytohabitans sp. LJ34 TaxID=3452217 RepID=UPI003F89EA83
MRAGRLRTVALVLVAAPAALAAALALAGPHLAPHRGDAIVGIPYEPARPGLPLGTDHLGRDVLSGLLAGARGVVVVPVLAVALGSLVAVPLGLLAGWRSGRGSRLLLRATELLLVLPPLLVLVIVVGSRAPAGLVVAVVALLGVPTSVRYLRGAAARVAGSGYVEHAVAMGERRTAILARELAPALAGPILTDAGLRLVGSIYLVATLSFLGFAPIGGQNWATMVARNADAGGLNPAALLAPGLCVVAFTVSVNLLADRLAGRLRGAR